VHILILLLVVIATSVVRVVRALWVGSLEESAKDSHHFMGDSSEIPKPEAAFFMA
jgi:hypothetical protein